MTVYLPELEKYFVEEYGEQFVYSDRFYEEVLEKKFPTDDHWFCIDFDYTLIDGYFGGSDLDLIWDKSKFTDAENSIIENNCAMIISKIEKEIQSYYDDDYF